MPSKEPSRYPSRACTFLKVLTVLLDSIVVARSRVLTHHYRCRLHQDFISLCELNMQRSFNNLAILKFHFNNKRCLSHGGTACTICQWCQRFCVLFLKICTPSISPLNILSTWPPICVGTSSRARVSLADAKQRARGVCINWAQSPILCPLFKPDLTTCDQVWPVATRCDRCDPIRGPRDDQMWWMWPDVTGITKCDQIWPGVTRCHLMWPDVTRCDQI